MLADLPSDAEARAPARGARARRVRHPLSADHRTGDGQGRRGHRLLPLPAADRAQRGRRRSGPLLAGRRGRSTGPTWLGRPVPAAPARFADPRHQAQRRRPRADRRRSPTTPPSGADWSPAGARPTEPLRPGPGPDANEEYLIYQTLVGAWPIESERLAPIWRRRCARPRSTPTGTSPTRSGSARSRTFAARALRPRAVSESFEPFLRKVGRRRRDAPPSARCCCVSPAPACADIYQGDELWALNLVDPDNRRAVDWDARRRALEQLGAGRPRSRASRSWP